MIRFFMFITFVGLLFTCMAIAHNKTIKGVVVIKNGKNEVVVGANVKLEGTVLGGITNDEGKFVIKGIPDGTFNLIVSSIGMHTVKKEISLKHIEGDEIELKVEMEENPIKVTNVVVTATRSEKIYDDIPIKVSSISQKDIQISSSNNIRESLQYQPGVRTEVNCQNCGFSQVRINGLDGKYSQILIDGKAIFSSLNGVYGLDQIPANMIERVEVIRGGASSLYGGNAIAGVVNVITKIPVYNSYDVSWNNVMVESRIPENTLTINGNLISDEQNVGISIFGMKNDRHEFDANDDGYSEIGRMAILTFGSKLFFKLTPRTKITTEFNVINHKVRGGNKINLQPHEADITELAENKTLIGHISYEQFIGFANKVNVYLAFQNTDRNSYYGTNKDVNAYGRTNNITYSAGLNYSNNFDELLGDHNVILGYEYNSDEMNDEAVKYNRVIEQKTNSSGFYIQDDWILNGNLNFLIGARLDKHNLIDNPIINPRASLLYKPLETLSLRATYSTGYRAPQAFDEDLHITQVGGEGIVIKIEDKLKPEFSKSFSISSDYSFYISKLPFAMSLEYFYTKLDDVFALIDKGSDNKGSRILLRENSESAIVNGFTSELVSNYSDHYYFKIGLTFQKSVFTDEIEWSSGDSVMSIAPKFSKKIFRTPDNYGYFLLSINPIEELSIDFSGYFTGRMFLPHYAGYIQSDELKETNLFIDLNAKISYIFTSNPNIELSIGVQNILNSYQTDFDKGMSRDAGFIYGPFRPLSTYFKLRFYY